MSMPASVRARSMNTSAFVASRTALVATARSGAPWLSAMRRIRRRRAMPRSMASTRQLLHVAAAVAEPNGLLLAGERPRSGCRPRPGDDEVEAVGADVQRGEQVARRSASSRVSVLAGMHAVQHAVAEAVDLLERRALPVGVRRLVATSRSR